MAVFMDLMVGLSKVLIGTHDVVVAYRLSLSPDVQIVIDLVVVFGANPAPCQPLSVGHHLKVVTRIFLGLCFGLFGIVRLDDFLVRASQRIVKLYEIVWHGSSPGYTSSWFGFRSPVA